MNIQRSLGLHFIVEPQGTCLTKEEAAQLKKLQPAGIMFRKRNFLQEADYSSWLSAYRILVEQIRECIDREKLLLCIDHEGGRVIRPPLPITRFPYAARWGGRTSEVAEAMACELRSLGINLSFAPVVDIHSNPANPVIGERAFGRTATEVIGPAKIFAATLAQQQILPCIKHFPGHGDTTADSHYSLPVVNLSATELQQRELQPFAALIEAGIPLIMTAHIMFPQLDSQYQATISEAILQGLLREQLGFKGVIVADALGMKAIAGALSASATVVQAIKATLDLFLVVGDTVDLKQALVMAQNLEQALEAKQLEEPKLLASTNRIQKLLLSVANHPIQELSANVFAKHQALAAELEKAQPFAGFDVKLPGFE